MTIMVLTELSLGDMTFLFGHHLVESGEPQLVVRLLTDKPSGGELLVHRPDGMLLQRRVFRGWSTMPPPLPPFAALDHLFLVMRAVVMAKDDATVALIGSSCSPGAGVAAALAGRSWRPVSGQLLVVDRATGHTLPFQVPLDLRGSALEAARTGGLIGPEAASGSWRRVRSALTGESVSVRPELLGPIIPVTARLAPPTLVRLCQGDGDLCRLEPWAFQPHVWPPNTSDLAGAPRYRLLMPEFGGAEEAAALIDDMIWKTPRPGGPRTGGEHLVGLTTSPSV
ncbi:hypothetical protein [Streptosporangium sp. NPDC002721]|uniref:hypothetical protein n=1 Tax=Streptosporangium sp. NPDC002721 TaxID=3366188 RepID=UPI0036AFEDD1